MCFPLPISIALFSLLCTDVLKIPVFVQSNESFWECLVHFLDLHQLLNWISVLSSPRHTLPGLWSTFWAVRAVHCRVCDPHYHLVTLRQQLLYRRLGQDQFSFANSLIKFCPHNPFMMHNFNESFIFFARRHCLLIVIVHSAVTCNEWRQ